MRELTHGLSHQERWRLCSALTQRIIENLRDGISTRFDVASVRAAWNEGALGPIEVVTARPEADEEAVVTLAKKQS